MNKGEKTYKTKQNEFYKDVLKNALNDPSLVSQINIGEILKTIETENTNSSRFLIN